jgi:hypothetical protein
MAVPEGSRPHFSIVTECSAGRESTDIATTAAPASPSRVPTTLMQPEVERLSMWSARVSALLLMLILGTVVMIVLSMVWRCHSLGCGEASLTL